MRVWKKVLLGFGILGIAALTTYIAVDLTSGSKFIIPARTVEYHSKKELTELFWQHKDLLNSVKDSVLTNKGMMKELVEYREGDTGILTDHEKEFFSEAEWADIVTVFEELHPYMLMMERKGRPLKFYINFPDLELDAGSKSTSLYWFPSEEEIKYHEEWSLAIALSIRKSTGTGILSKRLFLGKVTFKIR